MNTTMIITFLLPLIRHALVSYGIVEIGKADEVSGQVAGAVCTLLGFGWSLWNANQAKNLKQTAKQSADSNQQPLS